MARVFAMLSVLALLSLFSRDVRSDGNSNSTQIHGGYMGVSLEVAPGGLRVVTVSPGSPASTAGIVPGDIIVEANGGPTATAELFTLSVRTAGAGHQYPVSVLRGTRRMALQVLLTQVPRVGVTVGSPPPVLVAQVARGSGPADLEQLRGHVVIVDFWASWCGPCRMVMPMLNRLHQRYAAQGLSILGVTDESVSVASLVGTQLSIGYTLASEPSAASRFGISGLPTMVVIDRRGNVRRVTVGVDSDEMRQLDPLLQQLLAESAGP